MWLKNEGEKNTKMEKWRIPYLNWTIKIAIPLSRPHIGWKKSLQKQSFFAKIDEVRGWLQAERRAQMRKIEKHQSKYDKNQYFSQNGRHQETPIIYVWYVGRTGKLDSKKRPKKTPKRKKM